MQQQDEKLKIGKIYKDIREMTGFSQEDVNGDIFPCHRYSGILNARLGNVLEEKMNGSKYVYMQRK